MIVGIGTDICDVRRIEATLARRGDRFAERVLGPAELQVFHARRARTPARGVRYLATLFGLTMLSHQLGAFFGAWLGGVARVEFGDYNWMWYADMTLALLAAIVNLPIREARPVPALRVATA